MGNEGGSERDNEGGSCCGMMEVVNDGGDSEDVAEGGKEGVAHCK